VGDLALLRRGVEISICITPMYCSFVKPAIVVGTRLSLFHLFAPRTL